MMHRLAFSLVELLVVVAIVAILSAVAIPSYNSYIVKARILELMNVAQAYKIKLLENLITAEHSTQDFVLDTATIDRISIQTIAVEPALHVINVVAKMQTSAANGIGIPAQGQPLMLQLQGHAVGEILSWTCHVAPQYNKFVPSQCKNNDIL